MASPRRGYASSLRDDQSRLTRRRILDAAGELFLTRGYTGTTLEAVAERAGVSVQTVYNAVGGKAKVLKAVYDVMIAGDDEPVPIQERPAFQRMMAETDGRRYLARYAQLGNEMGRRTLPLAAMTLAQAAAGDKTLREFTQTVEDERALGTRHIAQHVADTFGLRPGLDVDQAAAILWTLTAPEVADRLINQRGWDWDQFSAWLATTMADTLLGPTGAPRDT